MSLLNKFKSLMQPHSNSFSAFSIPSGNVLRVAYDDSPAKAGKAYFQLTAVELKVNQDSILWQRYPVLHSVVGFNYGNQHQPIEITRVTSLDGLRKSVGVSFEAGKVAQLNFALTGLVPYNGDEVEIAVGLLAMKEKDKVAAAIELATSVSSALAVPQFSTILSIARPLTDSLGELLSLGDTEFRLGYHNTFTEQGNLRPNPLRSQYIAIVAAEGLSRDGIGYFVENDHLVYIQGTNPPTRWEIDKDYILLRLDIQTERSWQNLPEISALYKQALKYGFEDNKEMAVQQLRAAMFRIQDLADIAWGDWSRIGADLYSTYKQQIALKKAEKELLDETDLEKALMADSSRVVRPTSSPNTFLEASSSLTLQDLLDEVASAPVVTNS